RSAALLGVSACLVCPPVRFPSLIRVCLQHALHSDETARLSPSVCLLRPAARCFPPDRASRPPSRASVASRLFQSPPSEAHVVSAPLIASVFTVWYGFLSLARPVLPVGPCRVDPGFDAWGLVVREIRGEKKKSGVDGAACYRTPWLVKTTLSRRPLRS
ncbi:hypothetical protein T310_9119, partial [Rasamsonia emersonii CBS 393.64]